MKLDEFVRLEPKKIRRDKELMQLFVNFYEAAFSFTPKCVGCSFNKGFKKLKKYAKNSDKNVIFDKNTSIMKSKSFELKNKFKLKILTYRKNGVTYRKYGHAIDEDFANELVKYGKSEVFKVLPKSAKKKNVEEITVTNADVSYESMNYRDELFPKYKKLSEKLDKKAKSNQKKDIIAFLRENES